MAGWDIHSSTSTSPPVSVSVLCPHTLPLTAPQCHTPHFHRLSFWAHPLATVLTERKEVRFISLPTTLCICTASRPVVSMCLLLSELYQYTHPGAPPIHQGDLCIGRTLEVSPT